MQPRDLLDRIVRLGLSRAASQPRKTAPSHKTMKRLVTFCLRRLNPP